ncbi:MAG: MFS transporter [Acidiferrobacteraceae bacterium]|jgi:UMF1 family MFS transporter|nr:MFS transporter [Acidiferrobacteraceae bacterium]|tara:strand:- start:21942 stop:23195 length:1254 start_codon:yes stop_codon:yes gene_type:complete
MLKNRRKIWAWAMYDWANSAFATTVMAGFFPLFFKLYWSQGVEVTRSTYFLGIANSIASLLIVLLAPLLGAIADTGGIRKRMLASFACLGVLATGSLYLIQEGMWPFAILLYAIAVTGFSGANVFYDALLVIVSKAEDRHRVSALGFALGYLGGGILFLVNVLMYLFPNYFGLIDGSSAILWSFITVAVWWAVFSIPILLWVEEPQPGIGKRRFDVIEGFRALAQTARNLKNYRAAWFFLLAYWLYIDGVDTIVRMSVDYGLNIGLGQDSLITALLMVQFIGFPAAIAFGRLGEKYGARKGIWVCLWSYVGVTIFAYFMDSAIEMYILAAVIGLVQGGIQALSRSIFSQLIPAERNAEFFGFYNVVGKAAAVFGPFLMGFITLITGNPRIGILSILSLFFAGMIVFWYTKNTESQCN